MATKSENARYDAERSGPKKAKKRTKRRASEETRARATALRATSGRPAGGTTARRNVRADKGEHATYALEDSGNGRPSRKSTRGSGNHVKPDANLHRRQIRRVRSPKARKDSTG